MKYFSLFFTLFCLILLPTCKKDKYVTFGGQVSDSITGAPVSGARIGATYVLYGKDGNESDVTEFSYTDASGIFEFTLPNISFLEVQAEGYIFQNLIPVVEPLNAQDIRLIPSAKWNLRIENTTGQHDTIFVKTYNLVANLENTGEYKPKVIIKTKPYPLVLKPGEYFDFLYVDPANSESKIIWGFEDFPDTLSAFAGKLQVGYKDTVAFHLSY